MAALRDLPLLVILIGVAGLSMLVPAAHGAALGDERVARTFLYGALLTLFLAALLALATRAARPRRVARAQLTSMVGAYVVLPLILAVPFREAIADTWFLNAWFEMVSCLTTTGATVYDEAGRLGPTLHLWRGLVGWMGGFFVWVVAVALLAPMNLGGFEVSSAEGVGQGAAVPGAAGLRPRESGARLVAAATSMFPIYAGLTATLWLALVLAGAGATPGLIVAMSTMASSGITAEGGLPGLGVGFPGEVAVAAFLVFALSRATFTGLTQAGLAARLKADHELRLGLLIVGGVTAFLFLRHWVGAVEVGDEAALPEALRALWGSIFTTLSFLTTTGFVSGGWDDAQGWSGLATPGVLLMGLAVFGGGVATTAGGVKLMRVWALYVHSARELERIVHPSSVGGAGEERRRLRRQGAEIAWVFFMLFAMSIALVSSALAFAGLDLEAAMVLTVASLSTTGPLADVGAAAPIDLAALGDGAKAILMAAMVLGRIEALALIALLNPAFWRA